MITLILFEYTTTKLHLNADATDAIIPGIKDFIAVIAGYRAAERCNRKAAVASTAALAEMLLCVLTGWAVLLVLLQPITACYTADEWVYSRYSCVSVGARGSQRTAFEDALSP